MFRIQCCRVYKSLHMTSLFSIIGNRTAERACEFRNPDHVSNGSERQIKFAAPSALKPSQNIRFTSNWTFKIKVAFVNIQLDK